MSLIIELYGVLFYTRYKREINCISQFEKEVEICKRNHKRNAILTLIADNKIIKRECIKNV